MADKPNPTELTVVDVLKQTENYFPETDKVLKILITLPCTCTVERSFSSLRRIKIWLRSTMVESHLSGLAMMNVHRKLIVNNLEDFVNKVVDKFAKKKNEKAMFSLIFLNFLIIFSCIKNLSLKIKIVVPICIYNSYFPHLAPLAHWLATPLPETKRVIYA